MTMLYIVLFTALDLITKWAWGNYHFTMVVYNPNMAMGFPVNHFFKFIFPLMVVPIIIYSGLQIKNSAYRKMFFILFWSGAIGNYVGRFSEKGVIDFIHFPFTSYYFNLADVYTTILQILVLWVVLTRVNKESDQPVSDSVLD